MIRFAVLVMLIFACPRTPIAQYGPTVTEIVVINGEISGYIQVSLDGQDYLKTYSVMKRGSGGDLEEQKMATVWQAGPKDHIIVRAGNWSMSSHFVTLFVKYFAEDDKFVGLTRSRQYSTDPAPQLRRYQWLFTKIELIS